MEIAVTRLAIVCFLVVGVSHIIQPRVWVRFFMRLHDLGEVGSFLNGLLHFPLGVTIVSFHHVWHGLPMVLTLIGWGLVVKGLIYFVFPGYGVKVLGRVSIKRAWEFVVGGIFSLAISGFLMFVLLTRPTLD